MDLFDTAAKPDLAPIHTFLGTPRGFDERTAAALTVALRDIDTAPKTVRGADHAQNQLIEVLVAHDHHAAAFLEVYHGITVAVIEALDRGELGPRAFFDRLPGRFAERHFDGVKAELGLDTTTDAAKYELWRPSFAFDNLAPNTSTPLGMKPPMAHFTVGMCCHINFDLACALDETIRELGFERDPAVLGEIERGHNYVDTILADKVMHSTELLAKQMNCPMSQKILESGAAKTVGEVSMSTIRRWRAKTFVYAMQLCRYLRFTFHESLLMRLQPSLPHPHLHLNRHIQRNRVFHLLLDQRQHFIFLRLHEIKNQLVMHLQKHFRFQFSPDQFIVNVNHRQLDHVRRSALDGRVDGVALRAAAHCGI
jgi:hypothetical protein